MFFIDLAIFPVINETSHSMFMTIMIMNEKFFQKLPEEYQKIVSQAGLEACQLERKVSIKKEEMLKQQYAKEGIKIVSMPESEIARMDEIKHDIYNKFKPKYGKELIDKIVNTR